MSNFNSFSQKKETLQYYNKSLRFEISMEVPIIENIFVKNLLKKRFESERKELENYQKERDKSYFSKKAVNTTYVTFYSIDTIFYNTNEIIIVYDVNIENATPGVEDYFFDIFHINLNNEDSEIISTKKYLNKDKKTIIQLIEKKLPKCKLMVDADLDSYIVEVKKNEFHILIWKGLLETEYENCINQKKWVQVGTNDQIYKLLFSTKKIERKSYIYLKPNNISNMYLIKGDEVEIIEEKEDWLHIRYYGKKVVEGWVKKSDVE
ncbi:MAG: hypothetical protein CFE22_04885 [Cytophagaceae bacterium BCCC1]|nr:MAG: hypothetical protein CFE22_04885 [Cytophagaceae bacterium BCCC1]